MRWLLITELERGARHSIRVRLPPDDAHEKWWYSRSLKIKAPSTAATLAEAVAYRERLLHPDEPVRDANPTTVAERSREFHVSRGGKDLDGNTRIGVMGGVFRMDRVRVYDIIYALTAQGGREAALFGGCGPVAREAFLRSLAGEAFPELWFEIPLAGDPWLDFHALTSRESVAGSQTAFAGLAAAYADALAWFAARQPSNVRQLALSYDTHLGDVEHPAVQLLMNGRNLAVPLGFLEAAGRPDLRDAFSRFVHAIPPEWYACYAGLFPGRVAPEANSWVRVECLVGDECQRVYASDAAVLREHLAGIGMQELGGGLADDVAELARSPFPLELQFDVGAGGEALPVLSASVRFQPKDWSSGEGRAAIGRIAGWLQGRGLADGRCGLLPQTVFAKQVEREGESVTVTCFPAFVKLRWREGEPPDAKAYLMARTG